MVKKISGYFMSLALMLLLSTNVLVECLPAQLQESSLPILPNYVVEDSPLLSTSKVGDTVRLLMCADGSKEIGLPEGSKVLRRFSLIPYYVVEVPSSRLNEVKGLSVHPDRVFSLQVLKKVDVKQVFAPGVDYPHLGTFPTLLNETSALINADKMWAEGYTGKGVIIAIIDTGIDKNHPNLDDIDDDPLTDDPKILAEIAFLPDGSNDTRDVIGHGTHVASIAAGTGAAGGRGFKATFASTKVLNTTIIPHTQRGIAPEAYLYNIKVFNESGLAYESDIIAGIEWAVEHGADVINLSLGAVPTTPSSQDPLVKAVEEAMKRNVVVCVAAGNNGPGLYSILSPATSPSAISVGAVYETRELTYFSSRGPTPFDNLCKPDVLAMGAAVLGANAHYFKRDEPAYIEMWGTSMAAPQVAGAAALLIQAFPGISALGVKAALIKGAKSLNLNPMFQGAGLIDVEGAFNVVKSANLTYISYGGKFVVKDATPNMKGGDHILGARVLTIGSATDFGVFLNLLEERGANITRLPQQNKLSDVDLSKFDILFIPQPTDLSSPAYNTTLIHRFVAKGGSLLFVGDLLGKGYNIFTKIYGIHWSNAGGGGLSTKIVEHPITIGVKSLKFGNPTASLLVKGAAEAIAYDPFFIGVAAWENSTSGGKVVVVADDDLFNNKYINALDNKVLALNTVRWLMTHQGQPKIKVHEVGVKITYPLYALNQSRVSFTTEVVNFGAYDEEVLLKLRAALNGHLLLNRTESFTLAAGDKALFESALNVNTDKAAGRLTLRVEATIKEDAVKSNNVVEAELLVLPKLNRTGFSPKFAFLTPQQIDSFTPPLIALYPEDFKVLRIGVYTTERLNASLEIRGNVSKLASFSNATHLTLHHKVGENVDPVPYLFNYGYEYATGHLVSLVDAEGFTSAALQIIVPPSVKKGVYVGDVLLKDDSTILASTRVVVEVRQPRVKMVFDDVFQGFIYNGIYYPYDAERLWGGSFQGLDVFMWWRLLSENGVDVDSLWQTLYDRGEEEPWHIFLSGEYDVVMLHDTELHNFRRSLLPSILKKGLGLIIHLDIGFEYAYLTQFNLEARQNFIDGFLNPLVSLGKLKSNDYVPLYSALTLTLNEGSLPLATAHIPYIPGSSGVVMAAYTSNEGGRLVVLGESNLYEVPDDFNWLYFKLLFDVDVVSSAWAKLALAEVEYASKPPFAAYFTSA